MFFKEQTLIKVMTPVNTLLVIIMAFLYEIYFSIIYITLSWFDTKIYEFTEVATIPVKGDKCRIHFWSHKLGNKFWFGNWKTKKN